MNSERTIQMEKTRTIITTDLECDDMNSLIHLCLHLNELDVQAIIYTSSRYHFNGDGIHTLGEITPHYSCSGKRSYEQRNRPPASACGKQIMRSS